MIPPDTCDDCGRPLNGPAFQVGTSVTVCPACHDWWAEYTPPSKTTQGGTA